MARGALLGIGGMVDAGGTERRTTGRL